MRKNIFLLLTILITGSLFFTPAVMAQDSSSARADASTVEIIEEVLAESADLADEPEELEGIQIAEPAGMPSNFGLWWKDLREQVSLALTFDPVKKAEKQLVFAEERVRLAEYITQNSEDGKIQEKAQKMLVKANEYIGRLEDKKDRLLQNADARAGILLKNIARHEMNAQRVLDKLEDKIPPEKLDNFTQFRQQVENRRQTFLETLKNTDSLPEEIKENAQNIASKIKNQIENRKEFRAEQKDLLEEIKAGNQEAKEEFEQLRQERRLKAEEARRQFQEEKSGIIEKVKAGDTEAVKKLREVNRERKDEVLQINQEFKAKAREVNIERKANSREIKEDLRQNRREFKADAQDARQETRSEIKENRQDIKTNIRQNGIQNRAAAPPRSPAGGN